MKEINDIKESKIINLLIPEAMSKNNEMRKEIRKRIRLNKIFNEFENKASNGLNNFINLSSQRYNSLKNGHNLDNLLTNSKKQNEEEASKILQDPFYIEFNLEKEKQKMKVVRTTELNKNISPILLKMKQPETIDLNKLSDFENSEDMYDFEYNINPNNKNSNYKEYINSIINNNKCSNNYWSKKPTLLTGKKYLVKFRKNLNFINKNKLAISKLFKKEQNLINKSFKNYKDVLENQDNSISYRKEISNNNIHLPKLKLLNYNSKKDINRINNLKNINQNINFNYLLSFSDKNIYKTKRKFSTQKKEKKDETKSENSLHILTEINNSKSYNFKNYRNTTETVVNSAKRELDKENDMDYKRKKIEKIFGNKNTPELELYDKILKKKSQTIKNERHRKAIKIIERQKFLVGNIKERLNFKIDNNVKLLDKLYNNRDIYNKNKPY